VAAYIETLLKTINPRTNTPYGKATVKQHLAAIRTETRGGQPIPLGEWTAVRILHRLTSQFVIRSSHRNR
jgi:hypothetical protein